MNLFPAEQSSESEISSAGGLISGACRDKIQIYIHPIPLPFHIAGSGSEREGERSVWGSGHQQSMKEAGFFKTHTSARQDENQ